MWPDEERRVGGDRDVGKIGANHDVGRVGPSSDVMPVEDRMVSLARNGGIPNVANLSVTKSSQVHIGPKFVSVTQTVQNNEVVKELSLPAYCWNVVKNSSRTERLVCITALVILILCTGLIVYFTALAKNAPENVTDRAPHEWFLTREDWLAQVYNNTATTDIFAPLRLVIVQHTVSSECHRFIICAAELRTLQSYFINSLGYDIPYNYLIGNDGRVYEGRGWRIEGAHTRLFNRCSLGLGFIGDYREELQVHTRVTEAQVNRTQMLLDEGVRLGYLHPDYVVLGARDLTDTESPGSILYNEIRTWPQYGIDTNFRGLSCEEIYAIYNVTITP